LHTEVIFARDVKSNKRTFYRCMCNRRLKWEKAGLLLNWLDDFSTIDKENTDVCSIFLASDSTNKVSQAFALRQLPSVHEWVLSIIFEALWRSGDVHSNRKKASLAPIFKADQKFKQGNYRPISLASVPLKIIESVL